MCGIAGIVDRDGAPIARRSRRSRQRWATRWRTAGPDAAGVWQSPAHDVLLVHRRLAIIDPGPDGAQPMTLDDGRLVIVFNGEVYNYRELRRELEAQGHRFQNGKRHRSPRPPRGRDGAARACARARHVRPRAVECGRANAPPGSRPLRHQAALRRVQRFLGPRSHPSSARCGRRGSSILRRRLRRCWRFWRGVPCRRRSRGIAMSKCSRPAPGWSGDRDRAAERGRFADAREPYRTVDEPAHDERELRAPSSRDAVRSSVRAHLVADVPVGVFLSGGIDSGALVSCATSAGATNLRTFTVGFDDESSEADRARVGRCDVRHDACRTASRCVVGRARASRRGVAPRSADHRRRQLVLRVARRRGDRHQGRPVRRRRRRAVLWLSIVHAHPESDAAQARGGAAAGAGCGAEPGASCRRGSRRAGGTSRRPTATLSRRIAFSAAF